MKFQAGPWITASSWKERICYGLQTVKNRCNCMWTTGGDDGLHPPTCSESSLGSVPVAYQVRDVMPMDSRREMPDEAFAAPPALQGIFGGKSCIQWFRGFTKGMRHEERQNGVATRGDPPMKPETITRLRKTGWPPVEEVRHATASNEDRLLELCRAQGNYCQMGSGLRGNHPISHGRTRVLHIPQRNG